MDAEGGGVQVPADLHIVAGHEADRSLVLIIEDLPLEGGAEQQHEVVWKERRPFLRDGVESFSVPKLVSCCTKELTDEEIWIGLC